MPGFFGFFDYTKEGPGVPVNAPPKSALRTFFDILFRKFWKLITINLMFLVFSIPAILISFFLVTPVLMQCFVPGLTYDSLYALLKESSTSVNVDDLAAAANFYLTMSYVIVTMTSVGLSYVVVGPVHAGVTYILRNYAREEHAFVWMDFRDTAKSNFKQSSVVGLLSLVAVVLLAFDYNFFSSLDSPILQGLMSGLILVLCVILSMMVLFLHPMVVTFKLPLKKMLRNALLLTFARFLPNLGILLLDVFLLFLLPVLVGLLFPQAFVIFTVFFYLLLAFSLTFFINNFYVYRQFRKYMIQKPDSAAAPPATISDPPSGDAPPQD
jgi:uncharacterized membrane protein YesL